MKHLFLAFGALAVLASTFQASASERGKAEHVVVVVSDNETGFHHAPGYTPALYELTQKGVFFQNHHPVYISSTEVNGTAIATGAYPVRSGIRPTAIIGR